MSSRMLSRRQFLKATSAGAALAATGGLPGFANASGATLLPQYRGPNVILIRFGGGVRRQETIDPTNTYAPYFLKKLCLQGTLFRNMEISDLKDVNTSHGQGTLNLLTGRYNGYKDVTTKLFGESFLPTSPTLFEQLRASYNVPSHETLIINGEDRTSEEFYTHSNHHLFGVQFRSTVLSLYWFKLYLFEKQLTEGALNPQQRRKVERELQKLKDLNYNTTKLQQSPQITSFWNRWREFYRDSGLVNPRGDALLTELSLRALQELRPRLMMINYNDPDYVHWGLPSHYTRAISIIDSGIRNLVEWTSNDPSYRDNTVFVIVPDCGRDNNPLVSVPFQHHFNSRSAREIFALFVGPKIAKGQVIERVTQQVSVTPTIGSIMGIPTPYAESDVLSEISI